MAVVVAFRMYKEVAAFNAFLCLHNLLSLYNGYGPVRLVGAERHYVIR